MKIPLVYPKIPNSKNFIPKKCIAFEKIDGTNLHWIWNLKNRFYGFGTRRDSFPINCIGVDAFNKAHPGLEEAYQAFLEIESKLDDLLSNSVKYNFCENVSVFTEYYGPNSFAGQHYPKDKKSLVIIDIQCDNKFISPDQFILDFKTFDLPKVIYNGKFTGQFVSNVQTGKYPVNEGVVCKGIADGQVYMAKIKTNKYMEKLKSKFQDKWEDYWE